ncbi:hypothetical protein RJI07_01705 [Mycoplasmatota bacterium WC30]
MNTYKSKNELRIFKDYLNSIQKIETLDKESYELAIEFDRFYQNCKFYENEADTSEPLDFILYNENLAIGIEHTRIDSSSMYENAGSKDKSLINKHRKNYQRRLAYQKSFDQTDRLSTKNIENYINNFNDVYENKVKKSEKYRNNKKIKELTRETTMLGIAIENTSITPDIIRMEEKEEILLPVYIAEIREKIKNNLGFDFIFYLAKDKKKKHVYLFSLKNNNIDKYTKYNSENINLLYPETIVTSINMTSSSKIECKIEINTEKKDAEKD